MPACFSQIVAVPYATGFDQLRLADEVHFRFERCLKALGPQAIQLSRFGVGAAGQGEGGLLLVDGTTSGAGQGQAGVLPVGWTGHASGCLCRMRRARAGEAQCGSCRAAA